MKNKIFGIGAAALILGTMIIASASAQTIQSDSNIHKGDLIAEEPTTTKETTAAFEDEYPYFGSISGGTFQSYGWTFVGVLCLIRVKATDAKITRWSISFGFYVIRLLPIGYTYTVTAAPLSTGLTETVTLTPDEPHARVNFVFY